MFFLKLESRDKVQSAGPANLYVSYYKKMYTWSKFSYYIKKKKQPWIKQDGSLFFSI